MSRVRSKRRSGPYTVERVFIDALREVLGFEPLYPESARRTTQERFFQVEREDFQRRAS